MQESMEFAEDFFERKDVIYKSYEGYSWFQAWYQQELAELDSSYEFVMVPTRFGPTHVVVTGPKEAAPLVLLHGLDDNSMMWKPYIEILRRSYRIYAPDIIGGLGKSSLPSPSLNSPTYGLWLGDLMNGLSIAQANFVGCRGGCYPIFKLATLDIAWFKKVVLLNPVGLINPKPAPYILARLPQLMFASFRFNKSPSRENALRVVKLMAINPLELDKQGMRHDIEIFVQKKFLRTKVVTDRSRALPGHELTQLAAPVLMIHSESDANFSSKSLVEQARRMFPQVETRIVPGSDLYLSCTQPEMICDYILEFLA